MSDVPTGDPAAAMGEWLRAEFVGWFGEDNPGPQRELVEGLTDRLNAVRAPEAALAPVVLYVAAPMAFICPGRYLYVSRGLLHGAWSPEGVAFVVAHEMAHHDLGHLRTVVDRLGWAGLLPGFAGPALVLALAGRMVNGPDREAAADQHALELCQAAGFDGERCLDLFGQLEAYALDHGDLDIVFGPDVSVPGDESAWRRGRQAAARWLWERRRGYPSIHDRRAVLEGRLRPRAAA